MRTKRTAIILITLIFALTAVISIVGLFSVKKVSVNFAVSDKTDVKSIQKVLDGFLGDNLLLVKDGEVEQVLKGYHYVEVVSVKKEFPNVLSVSVRERREIYYVKGGQEYFVTTEDGFVLKSIEECEFSGNTSRDKILLDLKGLSITSATIGNYLKTDNDVLLNTLFKMAKSVNLTDCIKSIELSKFSDIADIGEYNAVFETYSGTKLKVENMEEDGVDKTINAFSVYDNILTDYQKACGEIQSYKMVDGKYRVTYEQTPVWTSD
ncbi:MAG: FtsQ-type POTRA domain-containing protein [Clostridiales bacterium]|nr:FtsQ-type POTRA domain-containing protein [Clostridiales bacterium]